MYLTAGQYKGIKIEVPKNVRPTLSKTRQGVFNMLFSINAGDSFLDMFAGSALMGLEALSRGYKVKEIEISKEAAEIIKKNYSKINVKPDLIVGDALKYNSEKFDIVYIDPPWQNDYDSIINHAINLLKSDGVIVIEHEKELTISDKLKIIKSKKYGRSRITLVCFS